MKRLDKRTTHAYRFRLSCNDKIRYDDETSAQQAADIRMDEQMRLKLSVYQCHDCHYWHLTTQQKRREPDTI